MVVVMGVLQAVQPAEQAKRDHRPPRARGSHPTWRDQLWCVHARVIIRAMSGSPPGPERPRSSRCGSSGNAPRSPVGSPDTEAPPDPQEAASAAPLRCAKRPATEWQPEQRAQHAEVEHTGRQGKQTEGRQAEPPAACRDADHDEYQPGHHTNGPPWRRPDEPQHDHAGSLHLRSRHTLGSIATNGACPPPNVMRTVAPRAADLSSPGGGPSECT